MLKKLLSVTVLSAVAATSVLVVGCTESQTPYSVTGQQTSESLRPWRNPRYQDDKGHYKPELVPPSERGQQ